MGSVWITQNTMPALYPGIISLLPPVNHGLMADDNMPKSMMQIPLECELTPMSHVCDMTVKGHRDKF